MKGEFSKTLVTLIITLNVLFSAAGLYAFIRVGTEPVVLTAAWFSFTTGELWLLASIRKTKIKKGDNNHGSDQLET